MEKCLRENVVFNFFATLKRQISKYFFEQNVQSTFYLMGKESLLRILTIIDRKGKSSNVQWLCCRMSTSPDITEIFYRTLFVCIEFGLKIWMWETFYTTTFGKKFSISWAAGEVGGSVLVSWPGRWLTPVCRPVWLCTTVLFSTAENAKLDCKTIPFKLYIIWHHHRLYLPPT